ncbi:MAG TPA: thioredoxin [Acidimicrobiales bacterium]
MIRPRIPPGVPDGIVAVVKHECETCVSITPVLAQLQRAAVSLTVYTQDDPAFPAEVPDVVDDTELRVSWALDLVTVPTVLRVEEGVEVARTEGWHRPRWEELTGVAGLGPGLPELRPGCGSRTADPGTADELAVRFASGRLRARRVALGSSEDEAEAAFDRGWTDGLPVVPPTEIRVLRMIEGTRRGADEVVAIVPPDLVECTVEKAAINAVMAGCRPEYLPLVLAAVEAVCTDEFNGHGLLATTYFSGPVAIVNGPIRQAIGMNSGANVLGQGNRANATVGRALQLIVRNVGGGVPGGVDRATLGNPGKYTFCFAEDEEGSPWEPLSVERGLAPGGSAVTLFAGEGPRGVIDQLSRTPESLARSFAGSLRTVGHHKLALGLDAMVVVSPEHARVFREAAWTKARLREELLELLTVPGVELVRGAGGCDEGLPEGLEGAAIPKFRPDGLWFVHAGGQAGLFSSIIGSWINGPGGSQAVTREVGI